MTHRWITWLIINAGIIACCVAYSCVATDFDSAGVERAGLSFSIGILGLLSLFTLPRLSARGKIIAILSVSVLARLALLPAAPGDDINRYLWEGKLTALGISPYQATADDPVFSSQRDGYWEKMNHRDKPTAYPPLSMQIFRGINALSYSPLSYKIVFMLLDLGLIAALLALLHHHARPLQWAIIYGLSPVSLLAFSAEAHFDILMVLPITLALLALSKRCFIACGVAMGIAIGAKIMAIVIAPILLWRSGIKGIAAALITTAIPLYFYRADLLSMLNGVKEFGSHASFNGPIHQLLSYGLNIDPYVPADSEMLSRLIIALYAICCLIAFWFMLRRKVWAASLISLGCLILLSPVVHFWYLSWILPLIALRPRLSWISLSLSSSLYFLVWHQLEISQSWSLPSWAKWAFWLPFFLIIIAENTTILRKIRFLRQPRQRPAHPSIGIVIPTYHPEPKQLELCIESVGEQSHQAVEIIIADATPEAEGAIDISPLAASCTIPLQAIRTQKGRGIQIKSGVEAATADWIVILHADSTLPATALATLKRAIGVSPHIIGGAFGQRFNTSSAGLLLIEVMNEFRATLHHTSFGDQNQFLHRQTALAHNILTEQPLMEDVEISDRLNGIGDTLYLATEGTVSAQKWARGDFRRRFFTIIEFCVKYRLLFYSRQKRLELSQRFYRRYYGDE